MTIIIENALAHSLPLLSAHASVGAWDLTSFLQNARAYVQTAGGALLMLIGTIGLVWGGVLLVRKLMSSQHGGQQTSWGTIALLILIGGGIATGGWTLIQQVGSGGQTTITQLGGGNIVALLGTGLFGH